MTTLLLAALAANVLAAAPAVPEVQGRPVVSSPDAQALKQRLDRAELWAGRIGEAAGPVLQPVGSVRSYPGDTARYVAQAAVAALLDLDGREFSFKAVKPDNYGEPSTAVVTVALAAPEGQKRAKDGWLADLPTIPAGCYGVRVSVVDTRLDIPRREFRGLACSDGDDARVIVLPSR